MSINKYLNGRKESDIYESIIAKFLISLPISEQLDSCRLSYHAQKAWYYLLDCVLLVKDDSQFTSQDRLYFFKKIKQYSPSTLLFDPQQIVSKLSESKPTCGAIIFNQSQTKILIIKNRLNQLGFPKGKWNQSEQPEKCAARQVHEEIGLYIHQKINKTQKIQFVSKEDVPSIFFVVRGVKESEKLTIDPKQIIDVFWMTVPQVKRSQRLFVSRSRVAWKLYLEDFNEPPLTIQKFIQHYKPKKKINVEPDVNPFLDFKFDTAKLMSVFAK